jgi:diphthamide synthase (EF-2-diphthine--ammonia ligase)
MRAGAAPFSGGKDAAIMVIFCCVKTSEIVFPAQTYIKFDSVAFHRAKRFKPIPDFDSISFSRPPHYK